MPCCDTLRRRANPFSGVTRSSQIDGWSRRAITWVEDPMLGSVVPLRTGELESPASENLPNGSGSTL